ncbi:MAG TPA: hypothetical protein VE007_11830 [Thermoanaerobaculia bacterium]|nr:hypothetical protein [Thermoanaerobaculia bacterium]
MSTIADDLSTIDGLIRAMYGVISGPAGPRDWDRERALFHPGGRLMPAGRGPAGGAGGEIIDVEGYIASRSPFFSANDFFEVETARRTVVFGDKAQVLSAYEGRRTPGGEPFLRGINGLQLFFDRRRWWIVSIVWDNERADNPLPDLGRS